MWGDGVILAAELIGTMALYQNSVLRKHLASQDTEAVKAAYAKYSAYFLNKEIQENIRNSKEEQFQEGFLRELFVNVLGYTINPNPNFNLTTELKNIKDAKKTDGAILATRESTRGLNPLSEKENPLSEKKYTPLSLAEQAEWMEYFTKKKAEANALQSDIDRIDKEIDGMVYQLYGLSEEEIVIVENA